MIKFEIVSTGFSEVDKGILEGLNVILRVRVLVCAQGMGSDYNDVTIDIFGVDSLHRNELCSMVT